ncbi:hypothetical protein CGERO_00230 [Corynebacterium gerontici]|uniref:Uncharacterized protein n=1 Tax=Corynebacterium gerontici TaxID=2079234 RepID=A0A3G6J2Q6_9CORY|nr:hypothetical protein CGERO_00230 [Corynebacterium gerontici]
MWAFHTDKPVSFNHTSVLFKLWNSPRSNYMKFSRASEGAIVIATVGPLPSSERPATWRGSAYLRQAEGVYSMQPHELRMIEVPKAASELAWDFDARTPPNSTFDLLDQNLVDECINRSRETSQRFRSLDDDKLLRSRSVLDAEDNPTLAGLYAAWLLSPRCVPLPFPLPSPSSSTPHKAHTECATWNR